MSDPLSAASLTSWSTNAPHWDTTIGATGNKYFRLLQAPSLTRLLTPHLRRPTCRALDLATGNALCARWLARSGATTVLSTDGSENMLSLARARVAQDPDPTVRNKISFARVDVTSRQDLEDIMVDGGYDVILMNMAIMDVGDIEVLAGSLGGLLARDGVFVASVLHPVFHTSGASRHIDVSFHPVTGEHEVVRGKLVKQYLFVPPQMGIALANQPEKQLYFHRPMHELFAPFFRNGLVMDAMEEPAFTEEDAEPERIESSANYTQIPALLVWRMRLGGSESGDI